MVHLKAVHEPGEWEAYGRFGSFANPHACTLLRVVSNPPSVSASGVLSRFHLFLSPCMSSQPLAEELSAY